MGRVPGHGRESARPEHIVTTLGVLDDTDAVTKDTNILSCTAAQWKIESQDSQLPAVYDMPILLNMDMPYIIEKLSA